MKNVNNKLYRSKLNLKGKKSLEPDSGLMNKYIYRFYQLQEVKYKKTFKKRGFFMGFKLGDGHFRAFQFTNPETGSMAIENTGPILKKSEIRVEFFKTKERLVSSAAILKRTVRTAQDVYAPGEIKENKKFFRKSLTVQAGKEIIKPLPDKKRLLRKIYDYRSRRYRENVIQYDEKIDEIVINYGDFNSLQILGVLSLSNYDHLPAIPIGEIFGKANIVERILITIIREMEKQGGATLLEIEKDFKERFKVEFSEFEVGSLGNFIAARNILFMVDQDHKLRYYFNKRNQIIRTSEKGKGIFLDLKMVDPKNKMIPEEYYQTYNEKTLLHSKNSISSTDKQMNRVGNMLEMKAYIKTNKTIIDLTGD